MAVKIDPRVKIPAADIQRQFALEQQLRDAMDTSFAAAQQVSEARKKVPVDSPLAKTLAAFAGEGQDDFAGDPMAGFAAIHGSLGTMLVTLDGADAAPNTQQQVVANDILGKLNTLLAKWKQVQTQLPK